MTRRTSPRRGKAAPGLVLLLLLVVGLVGGLVALLLGRGEGPATAGGAMQPDASDSGPAALVAQPQEAVAGERAAAGARLFAAEAGFAIPAGVRLGGPGRLEGRVIDREGGAGVPGARVDLWPLPPSFQNLAGRILRLANTSDSFASRTQPVATTGTDADGRFAFEGVRQGTYFLDGRGPWHVPEGTVQVDVARSGGGGPVDLFVRSGGRIVGRVLQPGGAPARSGKVAAFPGAGSLIQAARSGKLRYAEAELDDEGRFLLAGVPAGANYELSAMGPGFALTHTTGVVVEAGADTFVEVRARQGGSIAGRVLSLPLEEGDEPRPLAGAHVGVIPRGLRDLHFAEELLLQTHVVTDAGGRYTVHNAPSGELDVLSIAALHLPAKSPVVRVAEGAETTAGDIRLQQGAIVQGRVVDSGGQPVSGVHVRWDLVDWNSMEFDLTLAPLLSQAVRGFDFPETDLDGRFAAGPFPGRPKHKIEFMKAGYEAAEHRWDPEADGDEITVTLSRGGAVEGIVMDGARAVPVTRFTISGDDRIDMSSEAPGSWNPFSGGQLVEDERGQFRVESVEPGERELVFSAKGYLSATVEEIAVQEGETTRGVIVKLMPGGTVRGVVLDPDGVPVPGAHVKVSAADEGGERRGRRGRRGRNGGFRLGGENVPPGAMGIVAGIGLLGADAVLSGPEGQFELVGVEDGAFALVAVHEAFAGGQSEPQLMADAGLVEDVAVVMSRGGGLYGTVTDRFDRPLAGALLFAVSPEDLAGGGVSSGGAYDGATDEAGNYRIEPMAPGGYFLVVTRADESLTIFSLVGSLQFDLVTVPADEVLRYDIVDRSAGACVVHGRVTAAGEPIAGGVVMAMGLESDNLLGVDFKVAQIRPDGTYEFPGLAAGDYTFNVEGEGPGTRIDVEVPDLPEYRLDLPLPDGGLEGRVVDATTGDPIEGAEVALSSDDLAEAPEGLFAAMLAAQTSVERSWSDDETGEFSFRRLQAGDYELVVNAPRWGDQAGKYAPADAIPVTIYDGAIERGLEIRLAPSLAIRGVVRGADGRPVADARVTAQPAERRSLRPPRDDTDEAGRFELRGVKPGTYDLVASADGYAGARQDGFELGAEGAAEVTLTLVRGVEVSALVLGPSGAPAAGAVARLIPTGKSGAMGEDEVERALTGIFSGERVSGTDGRVRLGQHAPGSYRLEVKRGASEGLLEGVQLEEGPPVELQVQLR